MPYRNDTDLALITVQSLYHVDLDIDIWAATRENLTSGFPIKRDSNWSPQLQRLARKKLNLACRKLRYGTFKKRITKALIRLCVCCSETSEDRFSLVEAPYGSCSLNFRLWNYTKELWGNDHEMAISIYNMVHL